MNNLVTVIIPTYNREKTIKRAISSVLNQTYKDIELIIVDDCSSDNTKKIIKTIKDERLKYYRLEKNSGACYARNYGIKLAKGDYIAFQDSDDEWYSNKLEEQLKNMEANKSYLDFCSYLVKSSSKNKKLPNFNKIIRIKLFGYEKALALGNFMGTPLLLIKRECINNYTFDDKLPRLQDWDFVLNFASKYKISFTNKILANVYIQGDSITKSDTKLKKAIEIMEQKDYKYKKELLATLYSMLAKSSKEEKKKYYLKSLKMDFRIKTLIKLILNY